jgi:hypothetical protein
VEIGSGSKIIGTDIESVFWIRLYEYNKNVELMIVDQVSLSSFS